MRTLEISVQFPTDYPKGLNSSLVLELESVPKGQSSALRRHQFPLVLAHAPPGC